jgi:branched-chain amino acid transport system permease protein
MSFPTVITLLGSVLGLAGVYALVNSGFVVLYRTTGVINFAQGQFMLVGAFLMTSLTGLGSYWLGLVGTALATAGVALVIYLLLTRFLLGASEFPKAVTTFMLASIITQAASLIWGATPRIVPSPTQTILSIGEGRLPLADVIVLGIAVLVVGLLSIFVDHTLIGSRMRALAGNETLALFTGIRVVSLGALAWGITGAAAAIAGVQYAASASASLTLPAIGFSAFPAAVLGGMDSITGILPAALIVAIAQTVAVYYGGAVWGDIVVWVAMLAALLFMPRGLFGAKELKRL